MENETDNQPLTKGEFLDFMKGMADDQEDQKQILKKLTTQANNFEPQLNKTLTPQQETLIGTNPDLIRELNKIQLKIDLLPKPTVKKFHIQLFPDQDRKLFYKIVFGRWLLLLVVMLCLNNLYKFGVGWSDNKRMVELQKMENTRIYEAWQKLYKQGNKEQKKTMDLIYELKK